VFTRHPGGRVNVPPTEGGLYFGHVKIEGRTGLMTVSHRDLTGAVLHQIELTPER
jgi:alkaline phosphatase D